MRLLSNLTSPSKMLYNFFYETNFIWRAHENQVKRWLLPVGGNLSNFREDWIQNPCPNTSLMLLLPELQCSGLKVNQICQTIFLKLLFSNCLNCSPPAKIISLLMMIYLPFLVALIWFKACSTNQSCPHCARHIWERCCFLVGPYWGFYRDLLFSIPRQKKNVFSTNSNKLIYTLSVFSILN